MRRYILFALLLCLQWTARGQATYDYRYWFDSDEKNLQTGTTTGNSWTIDADVSELSCTYHSIHMQVKDTAGVWSVPVTRYFIKQPDPNGYWGYYWFNQDLSTKTTIPVESRKFQIDVSALDNKMHTMHYQFNDPQNNATPIWTAFFIKTPKQGASKFHYWTDNNTDNVRTGECSGGVMMLDMTAEEDGFHVLHIQGEMDKELTQPQSRMFIKIPQTEGGGDLTCLCYVDGDLYKQEKVPSEGGIIDWTLDVSSLANGFHRVLVQVVTPSGAATSVHESFFFRTTMTGELETLKLVYSVDGGKYETQAGDFGTGVFHFDLDVSELTDGLHRINYMLMSETGTSTKMNSSFFIKTPKGGPGVASYKYWINEHEDEAVKVVLDERQELFNLISLLPVKTCPIRSSCFHFEIEDDGTAMMYAKNDFHIQFLDVKHYFLNATRQYVDYNVGQEIDEFTLLESGKRVYKTKPDENEVIWFKVEAERGDSLTFKTDLAASIDVFNAGGDSLYNVSGSNSVVYGGCHVEETGTYYVALHDVTAKNGTNIALDYVKIDRYAVLDYTPNEIGILGETLAAIKLNGNGYDKLEEVYLRKDYDILRPDTIILVSKADMTLEFTLEEVIPNGEYDIVLKFNDNDEIDSLIVDQAIKITDGAWLEPTIEVSYKRIVAVPYPITVSVTNNSNISMLYVPLNIAWTTPSNMRNVEFLNFTIPLDSIEYAEKYMPIFRTKNFLGKGTGAIVMNTFIPILLPGETIDLVLGFNASRDARFKFYAWTGKAFNDPSLTYNAETNIPSITDYYIDVVKELESSVETLIKTRSSSPIDNVRNFLADRISTEARNAIRTGNQAISAGAMSQNIGNAIGGIHLGLMNQIEMANREAYGGAYEEFQRDYTLHPPTDIFNSGLAGLLARFYDYETGNNENSQPSPDENSIYIYTPADPNDILGYTSESGSKYIKKGVTDVDYTIRFENDPELATAAAHTIVVTDTIDGNVHDLSSFTPTSVKIGNIVTELDGEKNFVKTIDLRPRMNVIAQVKCDYDSKKGIAKWTIESLDPMTMEPTEDAMDGVLPINSDGNGEGELAYDIKLKSELANGTEIRNRASIVFDFEEAIVTPDWINIIDTIAPKSRIVNGYIKNDTIINFTITSEDSGSKIWKYLIQCQEGTNGTWKQVAEVEVDSVYNFVYDSTTDYGFCVLAVDSAGNVEQKAITREWSSSDFKLGDANSDGTVDAADVVLTISKYLGNDVEINTVAADVNCDGVIDAQDIVGIQQIFLQSEMKPRGIETKKRIRLWQRQ